MAIQFKLSSKTLLRKQINRACKTAEINSIHSGLKARKPTGFNQLPQKPDCFHYKWNYSLSVVVIYSRFLNGLNLSLLRTKYLYLYNALSVLGLSSLNLRLIQHWSMSDPNFITVLQYDFGILEQRGKGLGIDGLNQGWPTRVPWTICTNLFL